MLDPRRLRLLRELSRVGTIVAVADTFSYTPSAVSQQLAALEREAGTALLIRSGRRVVLTPAGRTLAEHADAVLAELERADAAVAACVEDAGGMVRIGAYPTAVRPVILPAMLALEHTPERVELTVSEMDPIDAPDELRCDRIDLAVVHDYDNVPITLGSGFETEPLLDEQVYLASTAPVFGPDVVRRRSADRWIVGNVGTLCHTMTLRTCQHAGFEPEVAHRIDDFAAVLQLVAGGAGVALVPELCARDCPPGVTFSPTGITRRTRIAYRDGSRTRPAFVLVAAALRTAADAI